MTLPVPNPPQFLYTTHIQNRRPIDKFHTNIGHAKNAVNSHNGGTIRSLIDGEWSTLYDVPYGTDSRRMPWRIEKTKEEEQNRRKAESARSQQVLKATQQDLNELYNGHVFFSLDKTEKIIEIVRNRY